MPHRFSNVPLILVSGQARSGTTILTRAIGEHPAILSNLKESTYIRDVLELLRANLSSQSRQRQMLVSPEAFVNEFRDATLNVLFPESFIEASPFADSTPSAISTFSSLKTGLEDYVDVLFPGAMILNIIRSGTEVVSSRMNHSQIGKRTFEEHCLAWAAAVDVLKWAGNDRRLYLVRHEDLLSPEKNQAVFDRFFDWAGLDGSDRCTRFVLDTLINTTDQPGESTATPKQLAARSSRWKSWSNQQRTQFEELCGAAMEFLGYKIPWHD